MREMKWSAEQGHALRERRRRRGLTQEVLAERAGVGLKTIKALEHGTREPRPSTLQLLAEALGCSWEEFCGLASDLSGARAPVPARS